MTASTDPTRDAGSGSLLGLALVGCVGSVVMLLVPVSAGLGIRETVGGAADASALAAADVAAGIAPGFPCDTARVVAAANGSVVTACAVDGLVVTVRVERTFLGMPITAISTAGPPGVVTN
jgi:secretion/DNA translocation related TadE-like protein